MATGHNGAVTFHMPVESTTLGTEGAGLCTQACLSRRSSLEQGGNSLSAKVFYAGSKRLPGMGWVISLVSPPLPGPLSRSCASSGCLDQTICCHSSLEEPTSAHLSSSTKLSLSQDGEGPFLTVRMARGGK